MLSNHNDQDKHNDDLNRGEEAKERSRSCSPNARRVQFDEANLE